MTTTNICNKLAEAFQRSGADCIGRPQPLDVSGASTLQRAIAAARSSRLGHHPDSYIYSSKKASCRPRASPWPIAGPCSTRSATSTRRFDACEDVELNHRIDRAGLRCYFTPEVAVRYVPRDSLRGLFRQLARYGRGRVRLWRRHRDTFSPLAFVPLPFFSGVVLGLPLSFAASWLAALYVAVVGLYAAIVLTTSASIALRLQSLPLLLWLPLVFLTVHLASGMGMLLELFARSKRRCAVADDRCP